MFVAFLFIPVVAGNVFMEDSIPNIPEITERQSTWTRGYTIFDPCNTNKPGNRSVSCSQLKRQGHNDSKVYEIYILGNPVKVWCDMTSKHGGGWTVIQSRSENQKVEDFFERNSTEYERGFGTAGESFWIGLENLRALTSYPNNPQALKIELRKAEGWKEKIVVHYKKFQVGSKQEKYKLTIDEYDGPGKDDALSHHKGADFSVKDSKTKREQDCTKGILSGGWWFVKPCNEANLNGYKLPFRLESKPLPITWHVKNDPKSYDYSYDKVEMKIRDADFGFCTGRQKS
uniref:Putative ixoderin b5 n=2 Tax=Ixodes ricinus TaxID=34613 RepID=V5HA97_IXORI